MDLKFFNLIMLLIMVLLQSEMAIMKFVNVALHKPTRQIDSLHEGHVPSKAVDGDRNQLHAARACTHTAAGNNTWWVVDLLYIYDVYTIQITNRNRDVYRLQDFYIYVSIVDPLPIPAKNNTFTGQLCVYYQDIFPYRLGPYRIHCDQPIKGRYVYVWKQHHDVLSLCEFEVLIKTKTERHCARLFGRRIHLAPISSKYIRFGTIGDCLLMCVSSASSSTHVQFHKMSNNCECIHYHELGTASSKVTADPDSDLCQLSEISDQTVLGPMIN